MIELQMAEMNRVDLMYEEKVQIYWERIMASMKQGGGYLAQIEGFTEDKRKRMEAVPQMVGVGFGQGLVKDIESYVSITFDDTISQRSYNEVMLIDMNKS